MLNPDDHNKEWWQATVVLGNFKDELDAINAIAELEHRKDFIEGRTKGSFHA